ncbi:MAG: CPBP family intramembrane metalloprotease [Oscillospiraceae bacterium]|nr:CPBP family intramembrane metalloprotease [Oscillospiraceae bacterium]
MSDEEVVFYPQTGEPPEKKQSLEPGFRSICTRIGLVMIVTFVSRVAAEIVGALIMISPFYDNLSPAMGQLLNFGLSAVFLNFIPMVSAVFILKHPFRSAGKKVYEKPKYLGRALAMFPACYGLAIAVNILTMLLGGLFQGTAVGDSFNFTQEAFVVPDMASAWILFFQVAIFAPICEELWFRGLIMESLRPYGNGFAIFVSAILFGVTHGNFAQFFYATTLGIILGYLAVSTNSIVTTTIIHAMFNSISGVMTLLAANSDVQEYVIAASKGESAPVTAPVVMYIVWLALVVILLLVGVIMAIFKLVKIKRYKVPKVQTEISAPHRWGIFLSRATVIVTLVLTVLTFISPFIYQKIAEIINA